MKFLSSLVAHFTKPEHVKSGQKWGIPRYRDRRVVGYIEVTVKSVDDDIVSFEEDPDYAFSTDVLLGGNDGFVFLANAGPRV